MNLLCRSISSKRCMCCASSFFGSAAEGVCDVLSVCRGMLLLLPFEFSIRVRPSVGSLQEHFVKVSQFERRLRGLGGVQTTTSGTYSRESISNRDRFRKT